MSAYPQPRSAPHHSQADSTDLLPVAPTQRPLPASAQQRMGRGASVPQPSTLGLQSWGREGAVGFLEAWPASCQHCSLPDPTSSLLSQDDSRKQPLRFRTWGSDWRLMEAWVSWVGGALSGLTALCSPCRDPGSSCPSPSPHVLLAAVPEVPAPLAASPTGPPPPCHQPVHCPPLVSTGPPLCSCSRQPPPLHVSPTRVSPPMCLGPWARVPSRVPWPHFPPSPLPVHLKCKSPETNSCN